MLTILEIISDIVGFLTQIWNWRFSVCFYGGLLLAVLAKVAISHETIGWIVSGTVLLTCIVVGWRWDDTA